jgi:pSer/pThr/pTyr-binding forkhead associated (FHA) protein
MAISSSTEYREPEWAALPFSSSIPWALTEIKGGIEVAQHDLSNRATTILGRAVNQVHIPLHHESISRQHARISFDDQGNPWLRDLQSAHGTYVNKRKLPAAAVGKVESNSRQKGARGIMLSVGDILKFGASSRYFSLEGPPPGPSEKEKILAQHNNKRSTTTLSVNSEHSSETTDTGGASNPSKGDEGISWGIDMGDDGENDGYDGKSVGHGGGTSSNSRSIEELDPLKIPEKYRKELDKLNSIKYKLANLETEDSRIRRKGGDLTDGQQKQLDRNAEREAVLRNSIREKEERLQDKLNDRSSKRKKATNNLHENSHEDEDDDFFDRTKNDSSNRLGDGTNDYDAEEAETEETLTLKWKKCFDEQEYLTTTSLLKAKNRVDTLKNELQLMWTSGNEEAFFVQNDLQLAVESKKKIESSLAKNNTTMDGIERLLKVVNPKIHCNRTLGYIGEGQPRQQLPLPSLSSSEFQKPEIMEGKTDETRSSLKPPPPVVLSTTQNTNLAAPAPAELPETHKENKIDDTSMPPPPVLMQNESSAKIASVATTQQSTVSPANKRKRIFGPGAVPPNKSSKAANHHIGTLSFLDHSSTTSKVDDTRIKSIESKNAETSKKSSSQKPPYLQQASADSSKMDVWRAPKGQDGSGKTKLNEKFAGRY